MPRSTAVRDENACSGIAADDTRAPQHAVSLARATSNAVEQLAVDEGLCRLAAHDCTHNASNTLRQDDHRGDGDRKEHDGDDGDARVYAPDSNM
jgi:hypothetical protein